MRVPDPLPGSNDDRDVTLFFVPYAGVGPMFVATCMLARTLQDRGHRVLVARCYKLFERCPVMDMLQLAPAATADAKAAACLGCAKNSVTMSEAYGVDVIDMRAVLTPELTATARQAVDNAPQDLRTFEFESRPFGKISAVDLVLAWKISTLDCVSDEVRAAWLEYLYGSVLGYLAIREICRRYPVRRLVHVNDYTLALASRIAADEQGIPAYGATFASHRNVDLRRYMLLPTVWKAATFPLLDVWPLCRELPLPTERVREIADDLLVRLRGSGSHIFSPAKTAGSGDPRTRLGLSTDRRLLVAYTSSFDEVIATRMGLQGVGLDIPTPRQPFADQVEWLTAVADFVALSDDLQLVIRVHPREGVTSRSARESEFLSVLRRAFAQPRLHCRVIWADEPVSSYDLGEIADLVLIAWSAIGLELARLGVPVLVAFNGAWAAMPVDDFLEWAPTAGEYFGKLRTLLDTPVTLERIGHAFRWYNLYHLGQTLDLGDVVPSSSFMELPAYRTPAEAETIERVLIRGDLTREITVARLQRAQHPFSAADESAELRRQIVRFVRFLNTGEDTAPERAPVLPAEAARYSPMIARLLPLGAEPSHVSHR